jgi:hypothetical protein
MIAFHSTEHTFFAQNGTSDKTAVKESTLFPTHNMYQLAKKG